MDDGPVFVGMIASRLGYAPTYDECKAISDRLGDDFESEPLVRSELMVLGVKMVPELQKGRSRKPADKVKNAVHSG